MDMDCILCSSSSVDSSSPTAKNVCLTELGILSAQKLICSLCSLLSLPLPFHEKFLQPDIAFCPSCTISLSNVWILLDQLKQLNTQIVNVRTQLTQSITHALENDNDKDNGQSSSSDRTSTSTRILRTEISKVLNVQVMNSGIPETEETESVDDSLTIAIASISDTDTTSSLGLETTEQDEDVEQLPPSPQQFTQFLNSEKTTETEILKSVVSNTENEDEENNIEIEDDVCAVFCPVSVGVESNDDSDHENEKSGVEDGAAEIETVDLTLNSSPKLMRRGGSRRKEERVKTTIQKAIEGGRCLKVSLTRLEDEEEHKGQNKNKIEPQRKEKEAEQTLILVYMPPKRNKNTRTRAQPRDSDSKRKRQTTPEGQDASRETQIKTKSVPCTFSDCPVMFRSLRARKVHIRERHRSVRKKPQVLHCPHCPRIFMKRNLLDTHVRLHTGENPFVCETCGKGFRCERFLRVHQTVHNYSDRRYPCSECPSAFLSSHSLGIHMRIHTGEKPFACELCSERFIRRNDLTKHHTNSHGKELNLEPYKCSVCCKIYKTQGYLNEHMRSLHSGDPRLTCSLCSFGCDRMSRLKQHMLSHTQDRPFQCTRCEKNYKSKGQLEVHMRVHSGLKSFQCKSCPKTFTEMTYLKRHEELHGDSNAHQCHLCGKSFPVDRYLTYHMKNTHPHRRNIPAPSRTTNIVKLRDSRSGPGQGKGQGQDKVKGPRRGSENERVLFEEEKEILAQAEAQGQNEGQESLSLEEAIEGMEVEVEVVPEPEPDPDPVQLEVYGVDLLT